MRLSKQAIINAQALEIIDLGIKLRQQISRGNRKTEALQQVNSPQNDKPKSVRRIEMDKARVEAMKSGKTTAV